MSLDITDQAKLGLDQALETLALLGLHRYAITVIAITNTDGYRPGVSGIKVVTQTRLSVGPDTSDGYHNPHFGLVSAKDVFLSGARLTDQNYCIGPIVYPYSCCGVTGGTDPTLLNPAATTAKTNLQLYFKVEGPGMADGGSYFRRKYSKEDSSLSFKVFVESNGEKPNLNV